MDPVIIKNRLEVLRQRYRLTTAPLIGNAKYLKIKKEWLIVGEKITGEYRRICEGIRDQSEEGCLQIIEMCEPIFCHFSDCLMSYR